jgi:hypothetical protein
MPLQAEEALGPISIPRGSSGGSIFFDFVFLLIHINLLEIRLLKKFSVCISILISSQGQSKVFWKLKI